MSANMSYVIAAWALALVVLGLYTVSLISRGRRLSKQVPPERHRWTS